MNQFRASLRTPPANMAAHPTPATPGARRPVSAATNRSSKTVPTAQDTSRTVTAATTTPPSSQGSMVRKRTLARPEEGAPKREETASVRTITSASSTKSTTPSIARKTTPVKPVAEGGGGIIKVVRPTTPTPIAANKLPESRIPAAVAPIAAPIAVPASTPRASRLPLRATPSKTSTGSRTSTGTLDSPTRTVRVMTMKPITMKARMTKTPPPSPTPMSTPTPTLTPRPPTIRPKMRVAPTSSTSTQSTRSTIKDSSNVSVPISIISSTLIPPGSIAKKRSSGLKEPITKGGKVFECEELDGPCSRESCAAIPAKPKYEMKYARSPTPESKESVMSAPPISNRAALGKASSKTIILELELPNKATSIAAVSSKKGSNPMSKVVSTVSSPTASPVASPTSLKEPPSGGSSSSLPTKKRLPVTTSDSATEQKKSSDHESNPNLSRKESQSDEHMIKARSQAQTLHHLSEKLKTHPPKSAPTSKERTMGDKQILDKFSDQLVKTQRTSISQDQLMLKQQQQQQQIKLQHHLQLETQSLGKPTKPNPTAEKRLTKRSSSRIAIDQRSKASNKDEAVGTNNTKQHTRRSSLSLVDEPGVKIQSKQSSMTINEEGRPKIVGKKLQSTSSPTKLLATKKSTGLMKKTVVKEKTKGDVVIEPKNKEPEEEKESVRSFVLMVDEPVLKQKLKHLTKDDDIGDKKSTYEQKKLEIEKREEILQQKLNFILREQKRAIEDDTAVDEETLSEVDQAIIASLETFGDDEEKLSVDTQTLNSIDNSPLSSMLQLTVNLDKLVALSSGSQLHEDNELDLLRTSSTPLSVATQVSNPESIIAHKLFPDNEQQSMLSYGSQRQEETMGKLASMPSTKHESSEISMGIKSLIESIDTERKSIFSYDSEMRDDLSSFGKISNVASDYHKGTSDLSMDDKTLIELVEDEKDSMSLLDTKIPVSDFDVEISIAESDLISEAECKDDIISVLQNLTDAGVTSDDVDMGIEDKLDILSVKPPEWSSNLLEPVKEMVFSSQDSSLKWQNSITEDYTTPNKFFDTSEEIVIDPKLSAKSMPVTTDDEAPVVRQISAKSLQTKKSVLNTKMPSPTSQIRSSTSSTRFGSNAYAASERHSPVQLKMSTSSTRAISPVISAHEKSSLPPLNETETLQEFDIKVKSSPKTISPVGTPQIKMSKSTIRSVSPTISTHGRISPTYTKPASLTSSIRPVSPNSMNDQSPISSRAISPTSFSAAMTASLKSRSPVLIKTSSPTSIGAATSTSIGAATPISIRALSPTSVGAMSLASVKTKSPTSIRVPSPTSIGAATLASVKTKSPTLIRVPSPISIGAASLASVKIKSPTLIRVPSPIPIKAPLTTSIRTPSSSTLTKATSLTKSTSPTHLEESKISTKTQIHSKATLPAMAIKRHTSTTSISLSQGLELSMNSTLPPLSKKSAVSIDVMQTKDTGTSPSPTMIRDFYKTKEINISSNEKILGTPVNIILPSETEDESSISFLSHDSLSAKQFINDFTLLSINNKAGFTSPSILTDKGYKLSTTSTTDAESRTSLTHTENRSRKSSLGNSSDTSFGDTQVAPLLLSAIAKDTISSPLIRRGRSDQRLDLTDSSSVSTTGTTAYETSNSTVMAVVKQTYENEKKVFTGVIEPVEQEKRQEPIPSIIKMEQDLLEIASLNSNKFSIDLVMSRDEDVSDISKSLKKMSHMSNDSCVSCAEDTVIAQTLSAIAMEKIPHLTKSDATGRDSNLSSFTDSQFSGNDLFSTTSSDIDKAIPDYKLSPLCIQVLENLSPVSTKNNSNVDPKLAYTLDRNITFSPSKERLLAQADKLPFSIRDPQVMCMETGGHWFPPGVFDEKLAATYFKLAMYEKYLKEKNLLENQDTRSLSLQLSLQHDLESLGIETEDSASFKDKLSEKSVASMMPMFKMENQLVEGTQLSSSTGSSTIVSSTSSHTNKTTDSSITVTDNKISDATLTDIKISDATLTDIKISDTTLTDIKIFDATLTDNKISDSTFTGNKISDATSTDNKIFDATSTDNKISHATSTGNKISDATSTDNKISDATLTGNKISDATSTDNKIFDATSTDNKISHATLTGNKISDATLTDNKISHVTLIDNTISDATLTDNKISYGTLTDSTISDATLTDNKISDTTLTDTNMTYDNEIMKLKIGSMAPDSEVMMSIMMPSASFIQKKEVMQTQSNISKTSEKKQVFADLSPQSINKLPPQDFLRDSLSIMSNVVPLNWQRNFTTSPLENASSPQRENVPCEEPSVRPKIPHVKKSPSENTDIVLAPEKLPILAVRSASPKGPVKEGDVVLTLKPEPEVFLRPTQVSNASLDFTIPPILVSDDKLVEHLLPIYKTPDQTAPPSETVSTEIQTRPSSIASISNKSELRDDSSASTTSTVTRTTSIVSKTDEISNKSSEQSIIKVKAINSFSISSVSESSSSKGTIDTLNLVQDTMAQHEMGSDSSKAFDAGITSLSDATISEEKTKSRLSISSIPFAGEVKFQETASSICSLSESVFSGGSSDMGIRSKLPSMKSSYLSEQTVDATTDSSNDTLTSNLTIGSISSEKLTSIPAQNKIDGEINPSQTSSVNENTKIKLSAESKDFSERQLGDSSEKSSIDSHFITVARIPSPLSVKPSGDSCSTLKSKISLPMTTKTSVASTIRSSRIPSPVISTSATARSFEHSKLASPTTIPPDNASFVPARRIVASPTTRPPENASFVPARKIMASPTTMPPDNASFVPARRIVSPSTARPSEEATLMSATDVLLSSEPFFIPAIRVSSPPTARPSEDTYGLSDNGLVSLPAAKLSEGSYFEPTRPPSPPTARQSEDLNFLQAKKILSPKLSEGTYFVPATRVLSPPTARPSEDINYSTATRPLSSEDANLIQAARMLSPPTARPSEDFTPVSKTPPPSAITVCEDTDFLPTRMMSPPTVCLPEDSWSLSFSSHSNREAFRVPSPPTARPSELADFVVSSRSPISLTNKQFEEIRTSPPTRPYENNISTAPKIVSPTMPNESNNSVQLNRMYSPPTRGPSESIHIESKNDSQRKSEDEVPTLKLRLSPPTARQSEEIPIKLITIPSPPTARPSEDVNINRELRMPTLLKQSQNYSEDSGINKDVSMAASVIMTRSTDVSSQLSDNLTKLSESTAFHKFGRENISRDSRMQSTATIRPLDSIPIVSTRTSDDVAVGKLSRMQSPLTPRPSEDTSLRKVSRGPSPLITKLPEHSPNMQEQIFEVVDKLKLTLDVSQESQLAIGAINQKSTIQFSVEDSSASNLQTPTRLPSRGPSPIIVKTSDTAPILGSILNESLSLAQWPVGIENSISEEQELGMPQQYFSNKMIPSIVPVGTENSISGEQELGMPQQYFSNKMIQSIVPELLPNKLGIEAFGSRSQVLDSKPTSSTAVHQDLSVLLKRDEILKTFSIALSVGKLTPELRNVLSAISKRAANEKESNTTYELTEGLSISASASCSHDMLPPQKQKSLQQQQHEVLSKLNVALESGKLSKELHHSLSELCIGEKTKIEQDILYTISGLLSPLSPMSSCSVSGSTTPKSDNTNTYNSTNISTGSIEFDSKDMKSIGAFDEFRDSVGQVMGSSIAQQPTKRPSIGLQMPTPQMSQYSTEISFMEDFLPTSESDTTGLMSVENTRVVTTKPPISSTLSMKEDTSGKRKQKIKHSSLSLGEEPLQMQIKPTSWSVGEILFRRQPSSKDKDMELKPTKFTREVQGLVTNNYFKEATSSDEIISSYGTFDPSAVVLERKSSSTDERPASIVTLGKSGDQSITPGESCISNSVKINPSNDIAPHFGEILSDATFLSQLVTSIENQQKSGDLTEGMITEGMITEDSETSLTESTTDPTFEKPSNLMAAIDSVLKPFQRWKSVGKQIRTDESENTSLESELTMKSDNSIELKSLDSHLMSDRDINEDVISWSRTAAETVDSLYINNNSWCPRYQKSDLRNDGMNLRSQMTVESGFHEASVIYPIQSREESEQEAEAISINERSMFILDANEWKGENLDQPVNTFAPFYLNLNEQSAPPFSTSFVQQQFVGEGIAMVSSSQGEMMISGQQFSNEQYTPTNGEQTQFVIEIPYAHSYANDRTRHSDSQNHLLGPGGQHFLSESKIVYSPHLGCNVAYQRPNMPPNANTLPIHTSQQSTPVVRQLDRKIPQSTPAVTKLRADATPFVQSNKTTSAMTTPIFATQYHQQGLSNDQQFNTQNSPSYVHQTGGPKVASLPGPVQYQQEFDNAMFLSGRLEQLSYPFERTFIPDQITFDGMNWQFQNANRKINDSNEMIPEPVADVPKPDPSSHWSSGESRSRSYDITKSFDQRSRGQVSNMSQVTPILSIGESIMSDSCDDSELDTTPPVEHFFSLVDVTLSPSFIPSRVSSHAMPTEENVNDVSIRPMTPGPYISQNESLDSQLDATEIPPPRNEHLFPQFKEGGGTAVSSALTLGKEFSGVGVGSLLKDQRMIQQHENELQYNNSKLSVVVSSNGEQDGSKLSGFNVDVISLPEAGRWSSVMSSEEYSTSSAKISSEQQFMQNIKDWSEIDEIDRISAEDFYPRQEMVSHDSLRPMSSWSNKVTRMSAEDFFQHRLLRHKIDDIQVEPDSIEVMREESRMSAEDFFQTRNVKHGQWQRQDQNLADRMPDRRFTQRFSQMADQWPPAQFMQNVSNSSFISNQFSEHFYPKNTTSRQQFYSKDQNHEIAYNGEQFYPKNATSGLDETNPYISTITLASQSASQMNQFCTEFYIQDNGQFYNIQNQNFIHKPEQYSVSTPQMTLTQNEVNNMSPSLISDKGKIFSRGISGLSVEQEIDRYSMRGSSTANSSESLMKQDFSASPTSLKFIKPGESQQMFVLNETPNYVNEQMSSKSTQDMISSLTGECFSAEVSNVYIDNVGGATLTLDLLNKNLLLDTPETKKKSSSLESRLSREPLSVIPEETRQSAEDFYKRKEHWTLQKNEQIDNLSPAAMLLSPQQSDLFVPITKTADEDFGITSIPPSAIGSSVHIAPIEMEETETQTQCVLIVSIPEELVPEGDFELKKRLIEDRLARLMEVELATLLAPPRPDSLMVVAESSVVELLNRYRELNSQQSLLEISKSACQSPNTSVTGMSEGGNADEEAIITVVAAANLQHSAAYRLEKFLESLSQPPIDNFVSVQNTLEGTPSGELEYEMVDTTLEGTDVQSTPAEMLICRRKTDEGSQTGDLSDSALVEIADETYSSEEYLEDILEESGEFSNLETSLQETINDDLLRQEEMEFNSDEDLNTRIEIGHGDVTNNVEEDEDKSLTALTIYKGRVSASLLDGSINSESANSLDESQYELVDDISASVISAEVEPPSQSEKKPVDLEIQERPSEQQLVVPQTDKNLFDNWKNNQNNHVTGFCLVEQPALLARERISTIRKRMSEHDLKSADPKTLMNLLVTPLDWPEESPIPKPRRSPKDSSGDNRQTPIPSPRKTKLEENLISKLGLNKTDNYDGKEQEKPKSVRVKSPILYLRLPKIPTLNLPPLPPSPPSPAASPASSINTASQTSKSRTPVVSPRTPSTSPRISLASSQTPTSSPRILIVSPRTPSNSPRMPNNSPRTPYTSPRSPIASPRLIATSPKLQTSTSTTELPPIASPRNLLVSKESVGDQLKSNYVGDQLKKQIISDQTKDKPPIYPKDDANKFRNSKSRSPSPVARRRHTSPILRGNRSPSPLPRQKLSPLPSRSRSTTPELDKGGHYENWGPIPLPRYSPKHVEAKVVSPKVSQTDILKDKKEKNLESEEEISDDDVKKDNISEKQMDALTDLRRKPSLTSVEADHTSSEEEPDKPERNIEKHEKSDESDSGNEADIDVSIPEPQESSPFLVDIVASPPASPLPSLPLMMSTLETIPEVGSQTELPVKRAPVKKFGPLKLTKEHLLSPKFLLELLTPPSMLHAKPSSENKGKQWRVPSPLPLSWLLPQSLPYRQLGLPHMTLPSLPMVQLEPTLVKSTPPPVQQNREEWLPPRLTLPSLHKPSSFPPSMPLISETTSSDESVTTWQPPSPTPLPEGAVMPAPLAMEVRVVGDRKVELSLSRSEVRTSSPVPFQHHQSSTSSSTRIDNRLRSPPLFHKSNVQRPMSKQQEMAQRPAQLRRDDQIINVRRTPSPVRNVERSKQPSPEVEEVPLNNSSIDPCDVTLRPRWSPRHPSHTRLNKSTNQRSVSPRNVHYQRPMSPVRCQHQNPSPPCYQQMLRPQSPPYHQTRYPPSPNRIIDQWFPSQENQNQQAEEMQFQHYPLQPYPYTNLDQSYPSETPHYTIDDLPPIPPAAVAKRMQSPYSLRTPSPRPPSPRMPCTHHYSPPRHSPKPATPTRSFHRSPPRAMGHWPMSRDFAPEVLSPPLMAPLQGVNKLYTLVIEDESGAESDESEDGIQDVKNEMLGRRSESHHIIDHQVIISEPGLSEEEDADAIANALHPEDGYPTYSIYRRYQRDSVNSVSPTYHQPMSSFHFQSPVNMADRVGASPPRNSYDMNWIPENMALVDPYQDNHEDTANSDSDDELMEGQEDDEAMES